MLGPGGLVSIALSSPARRRLIVSLLGSTLLVALPTVQLPTRSHAQITSVPAASATWLARLNSWRANAGLPARTENPTWSAGDYKHALYMVKNDLVTHYETAGVPYYTPEGDTAAKNSNIQVSSTTGTTDDQAIDWWMA